MSNYCTSSNAGNGLLCNKCRIGTYEIFKIKTNEDYIGKKTITEFYRCKHCGNVWEFRVYEKN